MTMSTPTKEAYSASHYSNLGDFDKLGTTITSTDSTTSESVHDTNSIPPSAERSRPWNQTLLSFGPLSGLLCILLAMFSLIASLGILIGSNGRAVDSWTIPPSTYLAIFTALANLSVRYAAIQGVVIAWWLRAMNGSTLSKLHWDWRSGTTLRGALTSGSNFGLLAVACIFSILVTADGPLLQRATFAASHERSQQSSVPLTVRMSPQIPRDFTGYWLTGNRKNGFPERFDYTWNKTYPTPDGPAPNTVYPVVKPQFLTPSFSKEWYFDKPIEGVIRGCPDTCRATITAPALAVQACSSSMHPVNFSSPFVDATKLGPTALPLLHDALILDPVLDISGPHEILELVSAYATMDDQKMCTGSLNLTTCSMVSAIGEYDVEIQNDTFKILNAHNPRILSVSNNTAVDRDMIDRLDVYPSTLGGFYFFMYENYGGGIECGPIPAITCANWGAFPLQWYQKGGGYSCPGWDDPSVDARIALNRLAVRFGAQAATHSASFLETHLDPGVVAGVNSSTNGIRTGKEVVFQTDYLFFMGAAILELICVLPITLTYWGWWKLGRPCSFSPLEMAKAFQSPMLSDCYSNASGRDLAKAVGDIRLAYGETRSDGRSRLAFEAQGLTKRPMNGLRFDE